jgi:hypothetical protein
VLKKYFYILGLTLACTIANAQLTYNNLFVDYDNAWQFKNLKIVPVRPKGLPGSYQVKELSNVISFDDALKKNLISVQERGSASIENVHWLTVYNNSGKIIYVKAGELLQGGRQDRMVTKDTMIMPHSGRTDLPVMCAEEGRWSNKEKKFDYKGMANSQLRKVLDISKNQVLVWKEIDNQLQHDSFTSKTLAYLARNTSKKFTQTQTEYLNFFKKQLQLSDSNIVGIVCVSGDKVIGSDIFATPQLFYTASETLLNSYTDEAINHGAIPVLPDEKIKNNLDQFLKDEKQQEIYLQKNGKQFFFKKKLVHITSY